MRYIRPRRPKAVPRVCSADIMSGPSTCLDACVSAAALAISARDLGRLLAGQRQRTRFPSEFPGPLISSKPLLRIRNLRRILALAIALALLASGSLAKPKKSKSTPAEEFEVAPLFLTGGRKLVYERSFSSEREVKLKRGFWNRVLDIVAGAPNFHYLVRPYDIATDSRGRVHVNLPSFPTRRSSSLEDGLRITQVLYGT